MIPYRLFLISFLFKIIPVSRGFKFKNFLLKFSGVNISEEVKVYSNVRIYGNGKLEIGKHTFVGHETIIIASNNAKITIGANVDIGPRVYIGTGSHEIDGNSNRVAGKGISKGIVIGNGTWIGANAIILPGVKIGNNTMIAAGSLVNKDTLDYHIYAGVPAKAIKKWDCRTKLWVSIK